MTDTPQFSIRADLLDLKGEIFDLTEKAIEAAAVAISGAPFPSVRSRAKAEAAISAALPYLEEAVLTYMRENLPTLMRASSEEQK